MYRSKMLKVAILGCTALSAGAPTIVFAQEAGGTTVQEPEIIVTATRREEALQDVPMAINVATGEDLQKLNIFDAKEIQQLAPSLELTNTNGRNNVTTLRGITFDPDQGTGPSVRIYLNETPVDAQTVFTAIYDLQQIEVLRGPQGLLRGQSSPAGAITFTTRRPGFDTIEGYAQATGTSRGGYNVQGGVTLPFSSSVSLRLAAVADGNRVNHVKNVIQGDRSYSRTESVRATLGLRPSDSFEAYLTYQYLTADTKQHQQVFGTGNTPSYQLFPFFGGFLIPDTTESTGPALALGDRGSVTEGPARFQNRTHFLNLFASYDLGPATISFVGGHQETRLLQTRDTNIAVPNYQNVQDNVIPYNVDSAELRIDSNNDEGFGWGAGAFYSSQTGVTTVSQRSDSFFFPTSVVTTPQLIGDVPYLPIFADIVVPVQSETWSFNGIARYKTGPFKIEGGIRYTIDKGVQSATINISSPGNIVAGVAPFAFVQQGVPPELQASNEKFWTGGANIVYEISDELNIYGAYGRSYRGGSSGVAVPVGISNDLIKSGAEKADSFELGFKGTGFGRRMNFSVAVFYQKIDGYLSRFPGVSYNCTELFDTCFSSPPAPPINNAVDPVDGSFDFNYNGDATVKGIEGTFEGRVTDNWDLSLSASYVRARYDDALLPCNDYAGTGVPNETGTPRITGTGNVSYCVSNGRLSDTPDFSLTANTEVRAPLGKVTPYVRALLTYRPSVFSERSNYQFRSRETLNLYLGLRSEDSRWDIYAFARNVLGQDRITGIGGGEAITTTAAGLSYQSGYRTVNLTNPREFGLTAAFNF